MVITLICPPPARPNSEEYGLRTILISSIAANWADRPADAERTFGYRRAGILAAFTNSILLLLVGAVLAFWMRPETSIEEERDFIPAEALSAE